MLTEDVLRKAFTDTNTAEPPVEGWPGLERFAREVERRAWAEGWTAGRLHEQWERQGEAVTVLVSGSTAAK